MDWQSVSEIVIGKILTNEYSPTRVREESLFGVYADILKELKSGTCSREDLVQKIGLDPIHCCLEAIESLNGTGNLDWVKILEETSANYEAGRKLEKLGRTLQNGEAVDWSQITGISKKAQEGIGGDFVPLSEIEATENFFMPSGWKAFDDHVIGFPKVGIVLIGGDPGTGKAQPLYSKILTESGWKCMGDMALGDSVYGPDGTLHRITGIFPQGIRPIYRVWFDDGSYTDCDKSHLWFTQTRNERRTKKSGSIKTLEQIMNSLYKEGSRKNHSIPITNPIQFEKNKLDLHPYLMGILLSEGCFVNHCVTITNPDEQVIERIKCLLPDTDELVRVVDYSYRIRKKDGITNQKSTKTKQYLTNYKLMGHKSIEKFIPMEYMTSSVDDRIELLRGLMDGDGYIEKGTNHSEYSTSSLSLMNNFVELCRGLGGRVSVAKRYGRYKKNEKIIQTSMSYRITVAFRNKFVPFYLNRKASNLAHNKQFHKRFITKVEYIGEFEAQCIYVDSKDHLYLTDNFIVTHNSTHSAKAAASFVRQYPDKQVAIFTLEMMKDEYAGRFNGLEELKPDEAKRILVNDFPVTPELLINKAATIENLGLVIVDYIDLLVQGDTSESAYARVYKSLYLGAKELQCPIIEYAQLNRYGGGPPNPDNFRYTKLAEALAWEIVMLYNPSKDWYDNEEDEKNGLPYMQDCTYLLVYKVRGGFRLHPDESPGAIAIPWKPNKGFHPTKSRWFKLKQ